MDRTHSQNSQFTAIHARIESDSLACYDDFSEKPTYCGPLCKNYPTVLSVILN